MEINVEILLSANVSGSFMFTGEKVNEGKKKKKKNSAAFLEGCV